MEIAEIKGMLDLRSDTLTLPTEKMRRAMAEAPLGDGGRVDLTGRGEDPTVYALEKRAAAITGKDDAIFFPSGTLANHAAMYAAADRGEKILVEKRSHLYFNEKSDFMARYGGLVPVFYRLDGDYQIDMREIEYLLADGDIRALCLENTHNYSGGTCLSVDSTRAACALAHAKGAHVHLDGARVFNAAVALGVDVRELTDPVDSVMFCVSKGLGAPVGSLLAGSREFIDKTRTVCKFMGTPMRQAGVIAAAGLVALEPENIDRLREDHKNAAHLGGLLRNVKNAATDPRADQTNFVYLDVTPSGLDAQQVVDGLRARGLLAARMTDSSIRLATRREITRSDVEKAAAIVLDFFGSL